MLKLRLRKKNNNKVSRITNRIISMTEGTTEALINREIAKKIKIGL